MSVRTESENNLTPHQKTSVEREWRGSRLAFDLFVIADRDFTFALYLWESVVFGDAFP